MAKADGAGADDSRRDRLAAQLRENLRRRKAQARSRREAADLEPDTPQMAASAPGRTGEQNG